MNNLIEIKKVSKLYDRGLIQAIEEVSLVLEAGKIYVLMGVSGCGKSTLLNLIGTLDSPSKGGVLYEGRALNEVGTLSKFRRDFIGFVFQFHHLIPTLTLRENVESALLPNRHIPALERRERALRLLDDMGILHRADSYASDISGGERQRGAIARALANHPKLLLADEPTGNVDSKTAKLILKRLERYVETSQGSILIATHDPHVADIADVVIEMEDGAIISMTHNKRDRRHDEDLF